MNFEEANWGIILRRIKENDTTPFAVLYPVVLMLTFPQDEFEVDLDTPTESKLELDVVEKQYVSFQDVRLPRWGSSYNDIRQNPRLLKCVLLLLSIIQAFHFSGM